MWFKYFTYIGHTGFMLILPFITEQIYRIKNPSFRLNVIWDDFDDPALQEVFILLN